MGDWVEDELAGYVAEQLTEHPRFKGASVRFVVLYNGSPQARSNKLSLSLRDRLQREVVDATGIKVAWQPNRATADGWQPRSGADCSADDAQYLIGLELIITGNDRARVAARAFDVVEKNWVAGFSREWSGRLSGRQRWALDQVALDPSFLGDRAVPYQKGQNDLMAAHLAHDLRCALMRDVSGDYRATIDGQGEQQAVAGLVELVGNNVAGVSSFHFASDVDGANARLAGEAHAVDRDLVQYWITLTPTDADSGLQALSTSVYVQMPEAFLSATTPAPRPVVTGVDVGDGVILDSMRLVRLDASRACPTRTAGYQRGGYIERRSDCLALEIRTNDDAVVFVLNHQQNKGLVRLDTGDCSYRTAARIARANEPLTFALPTSPLLDQWATEDEWQIDPDADTYYAIAVSNSAAARELASHLDELPRRCSESMRVGYGGRDLAVWLTDLSQAFEQWQPFVDWDAIRIKNVY